MTRLSVSLLIMLLALGAGPVLAKGDAVAGKSKAAPCQACHGVDGNAGIDPQYPRLAGQYRDYLVRALHEYKTGNRKNVIMGGFAATLSDRDVEDLASYFSGLPDGKLVDLHGRE